MKPDQISYSINKDTTLTVYDTEAVPMDKNNPVFRAALWYDVVPDSETIAVYDCVLQNSKHKVEFICVVDGEAPASFIEQAIFGQALTVAIENMPAFNSAINGLKSWIK